MATYRVKAPDGNSYRIEGPDDATQEEIENEVLRQFPEAGAAATALATPSAVDTLENKAMRYGREAVRGIGSLGKNLAEGVVGTAGLLTDTPAKVYDVAASLVGGQPSPQFMKPAESFIQGMEQLGGPELEPRSGTERVIGDVERGLGGALGGLGAGQVLTKVATSPVAKEVGQALSSVKGSVAPAVTSSLSSGLTREAGGGPGAQFLAGLSGGMTPALLSRRATSLAAATAKAEDQAANAERMANTLRGMESGYVIPPTLNRPNLLSRTLESLSGKAATGQKAQILNQEVTNRLAREAIGLRKNQPITEKALSDLREKFSAPYREIESIPPSKTTQEVVVGRDPLTNQTITETVTNIIDPKKILEDLKVARADARDSYNAYKINPHPDTRKAAEKYKEIASDLEDQLEEIAIKSRKPNLVNKLREARQKIAKTYAVENALNIGSTNVDARLLGRQLDKGAPLSGNLKDIALFAEANPAYVRESSGVTSPGVSGGDVAAATAAVATGHSIAGGIPLLRGPARSLVLSKPYQKKFARPDYDPVALAKFLSDYNPSKRNVDLMRPAIYGFNSALNPFTAQLSGGGIESLSDEERKELLSRYPEAQ